MLRRLLFLAAVVFLSGAAGAAGVADDASCDVALLPAATLLLPYFEVDLEDSFGETTLFTITNVTNVDTIAHVTLWTDRAFPVFSFDVYLTGYDAQSLSLYDILSRGVIAPVGGTGTLVHPRRGRFSDPNTQLNLTACDRLPGLLDDAYVVRMQEAFVRGRVPDLGILEGCEGVGNAHDRAIGYATIDVTALCSQSLPTDPDYFANMIRFDNVLIGDSVQISSGSQGFMEANPLVHIRAMPDAPLERTFYGRLQPPSAPHRDARQPLPSQFAVRWTDGASLAIWRDARTGRDATCETWRGNATLDVSDVVLFDEDENAVGSSRLATELPATSRTSVADAERYPQSATGATGGWMYLDLDRTKSDDVVTQNWITGAIPLGNGCTAAADLSEVTKRRGARIEPAKQDDSCDIALAPAATLLLPYFEVDAESQDGPNTRITITNVSPHDRIARVTLWTDLAYAVASFNVFLTGYDVHTIDLRELLARGVVGPEEGTGFRVQRRGAYSRRNLDLVRPGCGEVPGRLTEALRERIAMALTEGEIEDGGVEGCIEAGHPHEHATGYATIDVVRTCSANLPTSPEYWTEDLAYDNVLIGETGRGPLVHIRAVPDADHPRTFYGRFQSAQTPRRDARQPLPGTFAARWAGGFTYLDTLYEVWRDAKTGVAPACRDHEENDRAVLELVRFDEEENAVGDSGHTRGGFYFPTFMPATSRFSVSDPSVYPQLTNGATRGWMYLNLNVDQSFNNPAATQNWVVTTMEHEGRPSTFVDAAALGNGCAAPVSLSEVTNGNVIIGPATRTPNVRP